MREHWQTRMRCRGNVSCWTVGSRCLVRHRRRQGVRTAARHLTLYWLVVYVIRNVVNIVIIVSGDSGHLFKCMVSEISVWEAVVKMWLRSSAARWKHGHFPCNAAAVLVPPFETISIFLQVQVLAVRWVRRGGPRLGTMCLRRHEPRTWVPKRVSVPRIMCESWITKWSSETAEGNALSACKPKGKANSRMETAARTTPPSGTSPSGPLFAAKSPRNPSSRRTSSTVSPSSGSGRMTTWR